MKVIIVPYKRRICKSARELAEHTGVDCIGTNSLHKAPSADVYVNWGSTGQCFGDKKVYNDPDSVRHAIDKVTSFKKMSLYGVPIPLFLTSVSVAKLFLESGMKLIAHTLARGRRGRGIVLIDSVRLKQ